MRSWITYKGLLTAIILFAGTWFAKGQELNCKVLVNADQIQTTERAVFKDMENAFAQFLNTRKWTDDVFNNEERIKCNILLNIDKMPSIGSFSATVQIQSARPVFNTNYEGIILNFADRDWQFEYVESQPLDFNENSFISNLSSMLAYYAYVIIGLDYDTFGDLGGTQYFQIAQNIVTNAQQSGRTGWSSLESNRNRFWLIEELMNTQMEPVRKGLYVYHRVAMDNFTRDQDKSREQILSVLADMKNVNDINPNSILIISFLDAKSDELVNIFSSGSISVRRQAYNLLVELDPTNRDSYSQILTN